MSCEASGLWTHNTVSAGNHLPHLREWIKRIWSPNYSNPNLIPSSICHHGQRWSADDMPSVALRSLAITQINCFVVSGREARVVWIPDGRPCLAERSHHGGNSRLLPLQMTMKVLFAAALVLASASQVLAQKEIPKAEGHDQCPLGYVNTFGTTCVHLSTTRLLPPTGRLARRAGWISAQAIARRRKDLLGFSEQGDTFSRLTCNLLDW